MQRCVLAIKDHMNAMKLKMNEQKTDVIVMTTKNIQNALGEIPVLHLGDSEITAKEAVRSTE